MDILESNKLIAAFMGCIIKDEDGNLPTKYEGNYNLFVTEEWDKLNVVSPYSPNGVDYHKEWKYLMPVLDRIEEESDGLTYVDILRDETVVMDSHSGIEICSGSNQGRLANTYEAIVNFIKD